MSAMLRAAADPRSSGTRPEPGAARSQGRRWPFLAVIAATVTLGYGVILRVNPAFFYKHDTEAGAIPNWVAIGEALREGRWPLLWPEEWMSGNIFVESQGGLLNPAQWLVSVAASLVADERLFATGLKLAFAVLLATGVFRVSRVYGADPYWATAVGAAAPFAGWALYYDQASWVTALTSMAWIIHAWASLAQYARGDALPFGAFLWLFLGLSVGYAPAVVIAGVLVGCVALGEYAVARSWRPAALVALVGFAGAVSVSLTYLPALLSASVTWRGTSDASILNDNTLTSPWSETLNLSLPSAVPAIQAWGAEVQSWPVVYVAWFILPMLAFVDWSAAWRDARRLVGPAAFLAATLLLTAGPSQVGAFRWPARWLPYTAVAVLVLGAVLVSRYLSFDRSRVRFTIAGSVVAASVVRAVSSNPDLLRRHVVLGLTVAVGVAVLIAAARRGGSRAAMAVVLVSLVPVVYFQTSKYSYLGGWGLPTNRVEAREAFLADAGLTFQVGDLERFDEAGRTPDRGWTELAFFSYPRLLGQSYVANYANVGHAAFGARSCLRYDGSTCPEALERIFETVPGTDQTYADVMGVDRVVVQRDLRPDARDLPPPPGWRWVDANTYTDILLRTEPLDRMPGAPAILDAVTLRQEQVSDLGYKATVSAPEGGSIVFSRLSWPGYTATLDGAPLPVQAVDGMFVSVVLPAGTADATLALTYRPPGLYAGLAGLALGVGIVVLLGILRLRGLRGGLRPGPETDEATGTLQPGPMLS